MTDSIPSDDRVTAKLKQLHKLCICRTDPVNWADVSALLTCAESLQEIMAYRGGADHALEDDYVMDRATAALAKLDVL